MANDPAPSSQRSFKLCRGIRSYASVYLQENLLSLPSLPSPRQLAEIRERKEREAEVRLKAIREQREIHRQMELARDSAHRTTGSGKNVDEAGEGDERGFERDCCMAAGAGDSAATNEKKKRFEKLKKVIPHFRRDGGGGDGEVRLERAMSGSGWMGTSAAFGSMDSQEDPFTLQRQQLISYIEQAHLAGRMDEVSALQQSLRDIESQMIEPQGLYGFNPQAQS